MSSHKCVGSYRAGHRTCSFHNLYLQANNPDASATYGSWLYFLAVPPASAAAGSPALAAALLREELQVDLHSRVTDLSLMPIDVLVFLATPLSKSAERPIDRFWPERGTGDGVVRDLKGACGPRLNCLPPGVDGVVFQPYFFLSRTHLNNIGHSLWDDCMPFLAAMEDLSLNRSDFDLLATVVPGPFAKTWQSNVVKELFEVTSPRRHPLEFERLQQLTRHMRLVLFPSLAAGLTGMSPHNVLPSYRSYGAEPQRRSVWKFRVYFLKQLGISDAVTFSNVSSIDMGSFRPGTRYRAIFIQNKRSITNMKGLVAAIEAAYPFLSVTLVKWEQMGNLKAEVEALLEAHVLISIDGTASTTALFMRPGAVHINLGVSQPWGSAQLSDFLHASVDHVRVLYYDKLEAHEHTGNYDKGFAVPFEKLQCYLEEAFRILGEIGYTRFPLAETENLSPNGKLFREVLQRFPAFAGRVPQMWADESIRAQRLRDIGSGLWKRYLQSEPPAEFLSLLNSG